jgi:hypothetical protein
VKKELLCCAPKNGPNYREAIKHLVYPGGPLLIIETSRLHLVKEPDQRIAFGNLIDTVAVSYDGVV